MAQKWLKEVLLSVALLPLLAQPALAHAIWFQQQDGNFDLLFGHPELGTPQPYDPARVKQVNVYDASGAALPFSQVPHTDGVSITAKGDVAAITAFYESSYFDRNINTTVNTLKYTKALYDWSDFVANPLGLPFEILPLRNPIGLTGASLPVQVLYQGAPTNNVLLEYLGEEVALDSNGIAAIPVGADGLQPIEASYQIRSSNGQAVEYGASLTAERLAPRASVPEPSALIGLGVVGLAAFTRKRTMTAKE
ncbi:MAG: DUF4198 domain-containing protein [Trichocoleus desertorum ATA4-8-CV12]|jgi:nickel transport protein|nr:DUF4198 domain-containing protein [Trichocoleus desertorum ATA4-8-CV12]